MTTARVLKMENEDKEGITFVSLPSLSQVWSPSQKPKTRGIIVQGLLTPRWLVFLFPAPAEGRSTSGVAVGKKTKSRPFQVDAAVESEEGPNPPEQNQPVWSVSALFLQPEQNLFFFFQELSSAVLGG